MPRPYLIGCLLFCLPLVARAQGGSDTLVEVSGVTMTADSMRSIPNVSVLVKGQNRGTITNDQGVFSIVVFKGDTLIFRAVGFKAEEVKIPGGLSSDHYAMLQTMTQDTTYLPMTIIRPYPTKDEFAYAFLHWDIPDDKYDYARANTDQRSLQAQMFYTPASGREGVNQSFNRQAQFQRSKGQLPTMNIFNPLAWAQFFQSLKKGDFKKRD